MTSSSIVEHRSSLDSFLLKTLVQFNLFFLMSRLFKERFEASFFIVKDNDSFAEIITPSMIMKALKKRCEELKARLQAREVISSSSTYSERSRFQKILDSSLFTDEKNSI